MCLEMTTSWCQQVNWGGRCRIGICKAKSSKGQGPHVAVMLEEGGKAHLKRQKLLHLCKLSDG